MIGRAYIDIPRVGGVELVPFDVKRPANSPGWGMLRAVKTGTFTSKQGERTTIKAGVTRVAPSHWLAREYPEALTVADKRDARTTRDHARSLAHVRAELERGAPVTRTHARPAPSRPLRLPAPVLKLHRARGPRLRLPT